MKYWTCVQYHGGIKKQVSWIDALRDRAPIKNEHMKELGRRGGRKGGKARARNLSKAQLSEIGRIGAAARWGTS